MILLMGDSYGTPVPQHQESFTHREYLEAIREESNTCVLVFCSGESYKDRQIVYSNDPMMAKWQREVEKRHTLGFLDPGKDVKVLAEEILQCLLETLYDIRFGNINVDDNTDEEDEFGSIDGIPERDLLDDSEVTRLAGINANARGLGLSLTEEVDKYSTTIEILKRPNAIAALEQLQEAHAAIELTDYAAAINHLKRSLKLKPLDLMSNYWLARLYVALGYKHKYNEIIDLIERAIRIATRDQQDVRVSACYQIASRAATMAEKPEDAEKYAKEAIDVAGFYARAYIELARVQVLQDKGEEAIENIKKAFDRFAPSLSEVKRNPVFKPLYSQINALIQDIKKGLHKSIIKLDEKEYMLCTLNGAVHTTKDEIGVPGIPRLINLARSSILNQHRSANDVIAKCKKRWEQEIVEKRYIQPDLAPLHINKLSHGKMQLQAVKNDMVGVKAEMDAHEQQLAWIMTKARPIKAIGYIAAALAIPFFLYGSIGLGSMFSIISVTILYIFTFGKKGIQRHDIKRKITGFENELEKLDREMHSLINRTEELQTTVDEIQNLAKKTIEIFTDSLASRPQLIPFGSLTTTKKENIIRTSKVAIERYQNQFGRTVIIEDDIPPYLEQLNILIERNHFLAKVKNITTESIVISVTEPYVEFPIIL